MGRKRARWILLLSLLAHLAAGGAAAQVGDALNRGIDLFERQRYAEARAALEPLAGAGAGSAHAAFYLGKISLAEDNVDRAVGWLEKAVRGKPDSAAYHLELAGAYGRKAVRANFARQAILAGKIKAHLDRAVTLDPNNLDAHWGLVQFYTVAPGVLGGSKQRAKAQAAEMRRRNPYRAAHAFAFIHTAERNFSAAEAEYRAAIREYPDSARLYVGLARVYEETKQFDNAFEILEEVLRHKPEEARALFQIGRLGSISGQRLDRAEEALKRYLQHTPREGDPPLAAAHWRLGTVYERQGRTELARAEYREALRLDPAHREAKQALKKLGNG